MTSEVRAAAIASVFVDDVRSVRRFGHGHINETYLVETTAGDYVLQLLNARVFADPDAVMRNIVAVHAHLAGRLVPTPVAAADGRWIVHDDDDEGSWRLWQRVADAAPARTASPDVARSAGELLGSFHALVADLDVAAVSVTLPGFHNPARRLDALRAAVHGDPVGRARAARDEIELALAASALAERAAVLVRSVPLRVAHNDAKLDNVLFRGDDAVCLVDLDTLMPGAWFWDLGDLLRTASTPAAEDDPQESRVIPDLYTAVLDGYQHGAGARLDPHEVEALDDAGAIVTFEQAVRFLTDWIEGDVYYRTSRPHHNLDRARAQLRLLASMPSTVPWS